MKNKISLQNEELYLLVPFMLGKYNLQKEAMKTMMTYVCVWGEGGGLLLEEVA